MIILRGVSFILLAGKGMGIAQLVGKKEHIKKIKRVYFLYIYTI